MAVVRTTDALLSEVLGNADRMFASKYETVRKFDMPYSPMEIYDKMFGDWKEHMLALPADIIMRKTSFHIARVNNINLGYMVSLPTPMPIPDRVPKTASIEAIGYLGAGAAHFLVKGSEWSILYDVVVERERRIIALNEDVKRFKDGVTTVLKQFSTLAPALKAWPPLWDLLSEATKGKHRQVVDRKKPEMAVTDVNLDTLTTTVVMSKLTR